MSKILVVAEHDGAKLNPSTLKCVSCASKVPDATVDVLVLAVDSSAVAAQAAAIAGVANVLAVDNPANAEGLAAMLAPQVAKVAAGYTHVFHQYTLRISDGRREAVARALAVESSGKIGSDRTSAAAFSVTGSATWRSAYTGSLWTGIG